MSFLIRYTDFSFPFATGTRAQKEAKKEEKLLIKQLDKDKREAEKERKRSEREVLKEKLQNVSTIKTC